MTKFGRVKDFKMQNLSKLIKNIKLIPKCPTVKSRASVSLTNLPNFEIRFSFFRKISESVVATPADDKISKIKCVSSRPLTVLSSECRKNHEKINILPTCHRHHLCPAPGRDICCPRRNKRGLLPLAQQYWNSEKTFLPAPRK